MICLQTGGVHAEDKLGLELSHLLLNVSCRGATAKRLPGASYIQCAPCWQADLCCGRQRSRSVRALQCKQALTRSRADLYEPAGPLEDWGLVVICRLACQNQHFCSLLGQSSDLASCIDAIATERAGRELKADEQQLHWWSQLAGSWINHVDHRFACRCTAAVTFETLHLVVAHLCAELQRAL